MEQPGDNTCNEHSLQNKLSCAQVLSKKNIKKSGHRKDPRAIVFGQGQAEQHFYLGAPVIIHYALMFDLGVVNNWSEWLRALSRKLSVHY